jgi:hypothetical protein
VARALLLAAWVAAAGSAAAETPAPAPARFTFGGELSAAIAPADPNFFNYTDYDYNPLRLARVGVSASWRVHERLAFLGEVRTDNMTVPRVHAAYVRFRPWTAHAFDLQAGRIPPAFGAFARRSYASDNFLIGYPLGYQYLTSIRADALPANTTDLLRMRGRGWSPRFPVGNQGEGAGLPLVNALRWDTGVQARAGSERVEALAAYTVGTLSSPRLRDDNGGRQVCVRIASRPVIGLALGASAARGDYIAQAALDSIGMSADGYVQKALGFDAEYSRDYWILRVEGIWSGWDIPRIREPFIASPLRARALSIEGRYKIRPGLYAAARLDDLEFNELPGTHQEWDAPVRRVEAGLGVSPRRHVLLKAVYQHNRRDYGLMRSLGVVAGQVLLWY